MHSGIAPRILRLLFSLGALALAGCSVDMFSKGESDLAPRENSRSARPECAGLRLEKTELDVRTFRALITCFGANGSLPELTKFVSEATDRTLGQATAVLNTTFLANAKTREESRGVVRALKKDEKWDEAFGGFAPILRDPERVRALTRLLSLGSRDARLGETLARFDSAGMVAGLEMFARWVKSPAYAALAEKIKLDPLQASDRDRLQSTLLEFVRKKTAHDSANRLVDVLAGGKSASLWTFAFGTDTDVLQSTSRFTLFLRDFAKPDGLVSFAAVRRAFDHPIECWGGGKKFAEPWRNISREMIERSRGGESQLLDFVSRFGPLTALSISDFCEIPPAFLANYPTNLRFTLGRTGGEYLGLLHRASAAEIIEPVGDFVGEWGDALAEVLAILEAKSWFGDLISLFSEMGEADRERLASWTRSLLEDRAGWAAWARGVDPRDLSLFFTDLGRVIGNDSVSFARLLESARDLFASTNTHPWFEGLCEIARGSNGNGLEEWVLRPEFTGVTEALGRMVEDGRLSAIVGDVIELLAGNGRTASIPEREPLRILPARHVFTGADLGNGEYRVPNVDSLAACARLDFGRSSAVQAVDYEACLAGGGLSPSALAGLRVGRDWKLGDQSDSPSFVGALISGWAKLPLSLSEKREFIALVTGKRSGIPALTGESVREAIREWRERLGLGGGEPTAAFEILNRFQADLGIGLETWRSFFGRIGAALNDAWIASVVGAVRSLKDPSANERADRRIGPAAMPRAEETAAWARELECLPDAASVVRRTAEIGGEFSDGVLGWERPGGHLPLRWKSPELKSRLRAFTETLAAPSARAGLYSWIAGLDPRSTARWFFERGNDARLVAVMDPESRQIRVRWMTSLDRLESVLVNSNFTYILNDNYGLKFIGKLAEAWGDEPRARWPREIQARFPEGKRPPTLAEVYREIHSFIGWFEKLGGIPGAPECVPKNGPVARVAIDSPWGTAPDLVVPFAVKAKAFNLRQTLSVLEENLPGSGKSSAGGMRLLRDFFWAIYASAPLSERDAALPARNPLRLFLRLGDLGGLRAISRGMQSIEFSSERMALEDAVGGLRIAVAEPAFERLLAKFISTPLGIERVADASFASPTFQFGTFFSRLFSGLASDRTLKVSPVFIRYADSLFGAPSVTFPMETLADAIVDTGTSTPGAEPRLRTLRLASKTDGGTHLAELPALVEKYGVGALERLPIRGGFALMEKDPAFRRRVFTELHRWTRTESRQTAGDSQLSDLLWSESHPEFRRAIGLWCGTEAGRYAFELSRRPTESLALLDGLFQSTQTGVFSDFLDALLRELAD